VVKQADLVLAMHLRGEAFTDEEKARNFAYYEALTVRDSSLSACTQAVIAAEVGHIGLAGEYLAEAALMDLEDLEHNTRDGLHLAALAGTWIALVSGLAGLRERRGTVGFAPRLPPGMTRLAITLSMRQRRLRVEITPDTTTYRLIDGEPLPILHDEQLGSVSTEIPLLRPTGKSPSTEQPTQPVGREPRAAL
jgi:alpha,alpha-trehalose phosphorylase